MLMCRKPKLFLEEKLSKHRLFESKSSRRDGDWARVNMDNTKNYEKQHNSDGTKRR